MSVISNILVRAGADFSAIVTQSKKASGAMSRMSKSVSTSTGTIKKAMAAIGVSMSFAAVISASKKAVEAYNAQAEAEAKLAQVMKNTMGASSDEVQAIKDLCSAQQQLGVIGDEVQLAGAQELATYLEQASTLKALIPVMNDMVAQQYGYSASAESAATIATMLGKVMNGQVNALSRLGYKFDDAQEKILKYGTEEQRAATLAEVIEQSVGGMNQALANTPTGRLQQLSNVLGDIRERFGQAITTIGTTFLPVLYKVASFLATIATIANKVAQSIANVFGKKIETSTVATGSAVEGISDAYDDAGDAATAAGEAAKKANKNILGFDELNKLSDNSTSSSSGGSSGSTGVSSGSTGVSISDLGTDVPQSYGKLEAVLQRIKDVAERVNERLQLFKQLVTGEITLGDFIKKLSNLEAVILAIAVAIVLVAAAIAAIKAVITVINTVSAAFALLTSPIGLVVLAIAAVIAVGVLLYKNWETIKAKLLEIWEELKTEFEILSDGLVECWEAIKQAAIDAWENLKQGAIDLWESIKQTFHDAIAAIEKKIDEFKQWLSDVWTVIKFVAGVAWAAVKKSIIDPIKEAVEDVKQKIDEFKQWLSDTWESIKKTVETVWLAIKAAIIDPIKDAWVEATTLVNTIVATIIDAWGTLKANTVDFFVGIYESIVTWLNAAWSYVTWVVEEIRSAFSFVSDKVTAAFEFGDGGMYGIPPYAAGGYPQTGELFLAREAGPEMVGTIGGKTAVANNSDIVASISAGVFQAVSAAMEGNSNAVHVYLDGSEMTDIITRNQRRSAYTLGY